jgi:flagellar biosynthesis/type III secretory pathway M-ring protein FliF/YscJ
MLMFEDLDWKGAFRRAAFAALLYLLFVYVMSLAFPDSFGASSNLTSALVVAVAFFFIYAPVFAFAERRKKQRLAELNAQKKGKTGARAKAGTTGGSGTDSEEAKAGDLRGRHNPNTSRKKAARRRRR